MKLLIFSILFFSTASFALVVVAHKNAGKISFTIDNIDLPVTFDKTIKSGFSNIFVLQLSLFKNGKDYIQKKEATKIVFDLWDEVYLIKRSGFSESSETISIKDDVMSKLTRYTFKSAVSVSDFKDDETFEVSVRVVVVPISREKQKKIKTWLAENQVNMPLSSAAGSESRKSASAGAAFETVKRSVFNQVLESELDSDNSGGEWVFDSGKIEIKTNSIDKETKNAK